MTATTTPVTTLITRGRFVWYDLLTTDTKAAIAFYTKLIGWGTQQFEGGQAPYTVFTVSGAGLGGVMTLPEAAAKSGVPPHWMAHISTPDLDATVAQVTKLGGQVIVPATDIPTVGRFAVFLDPQGAKFAGFQPLPSSTPRPDGPPKLLDVSWNELAATDYKKAFDFYRALFGWEEVSETDMGAMGIYMIYGQKGDQYGGMFDKPPQMPASAWLHYINVKDVDKVAEDVKKLGGKVVNGPMDVPGGGRIAQCTDPQGAMFALHAKAAGK